METLQGLIESVEVDLPLERASTVPSAWYLRDDVLRLEREALFARRWQYFGPAGRVASPGDFLTGTVADEPVLVVRGDDGVLRGMSNVCRHRASSVAVEPFGHASRLRCPYHGWTYGLDGRLRGAPEFEGVCGFEREEVRLPPLEVAESGPFVFVRLDAAGGDVMPPGLSESLSDLGGLRHVERRAYDVACNWKVYVDNYLDGGYHVAHLHPALHRVLDYAAYRCETHEGWNVQISPMRAAPRPEKAALRAAGRGDDVSDVRSGDVARYYWVMPGWMINVYSGGMDTNLVVPLAVDRTRVIFDWWFGEEHDDAFARRSIEVSGRVQDEDRDICEAVQKGLGSRWYDTGRFSVRRENGAWQFHRALARALQAEIGLRPSPP